MSAPGLRAHDIAAILQSASGIVEGVRKSGFQSYRKADGSPVTAADRAAGDFLREALAPLAPGAAWLCEESEADPARTRAARCWIVDPLDGTQEFVDGIPEYAISVGLVEHGVPVAAGIANPATGEGGAWVAGSACHFWGWGAPSAARRAGTADAYTIVVSRGEIKRGTARDLLERFPGVRGVGSAAYKLLRVAAARDDLYVSLEPKSEWDICGGVGLIQGAGMAYRLLSGAPLAFNQGSTRVRSGAVAGEARLVEQLVPALEALSA